MRHAGTGTDRDCRRCYFSQTPAIHDRFYIEAVRPFIWFAALALFLSYVIGLLFTLRTHAAVIWNNELDEKRAEPHDASHSQSLHASMTRVPDHPNTLSRTTTREDIRESQLYKRILGQSLRTAGLAPNGDLLSDRTHQSSNTEPNTPHVVPPRENESDNLFANEQGQSMAFHVAEIAATAAAVAARDATKGPTKAMRTASHTPSKAHGERPSAQRTATLVDEGEAPPGHAPGGHDAPNWSRKKSTIVLLTATVAYAVIAEILVNTVDTVLENVDIDEKFLGFTLFALVPNTTEFLVCFLLF